MTNPKTLYSNQWQAAADGLVIYPSAKACEHGHGRDRYTSTGQCVVCTKIRAKARQDRIRSIRDAARGVS